MILEIKRMRDDHVVLEADSELCETIVSACELRGEWFALHDDGELGDRLETIATVWMDGRNQEQITTRVTGLGLAADACDWYARVIRPPREDELAQRAKDACRQLRSVIQEYRSMSPHGTECENSDTIRWFRGP